MKNDELRKQAEDVARNIVTQSTENIEAQSPEKTRQTIQELQVHQIELEMQNEKLRTMQAELDAQRTYYFDLYDLAPVGYCSISDHGLILEANLTIDTLLGVERGVLIKQPINRFIHQEDQDIYHLHHKRLFETGEPQSCELRMMKNNATALWVHLAATVALDTGGAPICRIVLSDITERKCMMETLRESEETFRDLVESLPDVVMRFDRDGRHLFVSDNVDNVVDLRAAQFIGKTHRELGFSEAQCRIWEEAIQGVFDSGTLFETEFTFDGKQGPVIYNCRLIPERNTQGGVKSVLSLNRDLTAHRRAERNYRMLFNEMLDGFALHEIICDKKGKPVDYRFLAVNPAFERMTGLKAQDLTGKTVLEVMPGTEPHWIKTYGKVALTGEPAFFENYATELKKHFRVTAFRPAPYQFACIFADVTENRQAEETLRESEQNFRTLADSGQALIWTSGTDKCCNYFNRVWLEFTGRTLKQEMGNGWAEGVHPDDLQPCLDIYVGAFDRREKFCMEYRLRRHDGEYRWILDDGCPRYNSRREFIGYIGHCLDVTERKKAQEEKARLETQLQQAQKMEAIGSLAGGIAHDLNNILFPISGLSEMLLEEIPPDSPEHESLEQIHKSAQRGSNLVKQILAFSRQSNPRKLPIRIQPILKEVLKLVRATIPRKIEITSHIQSDCGMVSADPTQVHQIMMNLITNAYHAVELTGGTINVELKETDMTSFDEKEELPFHAMPPDGTSGYPLRLLTGKYACITLSDTGTGMDQTLINKIFEPYFTTKEQGKGTGLGLSVVHGIVKEHGGDIRVYSEVGRGTAFHVYLPLLEETQDNRAAGVPRKYPTGCERILLVDDEEPIVRIEQMILEKLGYRITARTSSQDALDAFRVDPLIFDLVISDRGMPGMTGEQLAGELFSIRPDIPIILCTGFSDENDEKLARDMGIKGFLMKPVVLADLAAMVRKVLDDVADKDRHFREA